MYKLSQVEGALGALLLTRSESQSAALDEADRTKSRIQIKRLLEIDRERKRASEPPAFFDMPPQGKGTDAGYDEFGACCLAVGLQMLRFGFKQREVVEKIATVRSQLERAFRIRRTRVGIEGPTTVIDNTGANRSTKGSLPLKRSLRDREKTMPDPSLFLVIDELEGAAGNEPPTAHQNAVHGISLCIGWEDMQRTLERMIPRRKRAAFIVEVYDLMSRVGDRLAKEPAARRGRR